MSQTQAQYIKAKVNSSHLIKRAEEMHDAVKKRQKLIAIKEQEVTEGQQEVAELERSWKNYEKQIQKEGAARGRYIEFDKDQVMLFFTKTESWLWLLIAIRYCMLNLQKPL